MRIDAGLDTVTFCCKKNPNPATDTAETLAPRSCSGRGLLVETLHGLQAGGIEARPQDNAQASLARF